MQRVVLVTGASSGIGLEIAHALVRRGARVAFAARSLPALEREVERARERGGEAMAVRLDVTDDASARAAVDAVLARWGRLDVLVNDAGNAGEMGWWADMPADAAAQMFGVHVLGAERMLRAALPALRRQRGTAVNFSSTVGFVPMPGSALYSAAKAAINALTDALRTELAPDGVDVRLFVPPHTRTEAGLRMPLDLPKIYEPEWVAERFVAFLDGRRARVVVGGNGMLLWIQRVWPALASRIMNRLGLDALGKVLAQAAARG